MYTNLILVTIFSYLQVSKSQDEFPSIQQLFDVPEINRSVPILKDYPQIVSRNINVDVDKIDVEKLRKKLDKLPRSEDARQWRAYSDTMKQWIASGNKTKPFETLPLNDTRRQLVWYRSGWTYYHATDFNTRVKMMDNALQIIYMARHKIIHMEKEKHFNRKDTGYRIAFIYKHIRRLYRRLVDIYMTTKKFFDQHYKPSWNSPDYIANLHQKSIRIHVDFLYYYWVMIEIDRRYRELNKWREPEGPDLDKVKSTTDPYEFYRNFEVWRVW